MLGNYQTGLALWPLSINQALDQDNVVQWGPGVSEQTVNPLVLFGYFPHRQQVPPKWRPPLSKWIGKCHPHYWAFEIIFQTGNPAPPMPFDDSPISLNRKMNAGHTVVNSLARWRATREFRACLWLHNIMLMQQNARTVFSMTGWYHVGWTPPRTTTLDLAADGTPIRTGTYSQGIGGPREENVEIQFHSWGVRVPIEVGFRINERKARLGNYLLFGRPVPFMRMILDLEVRVDGNHRARFNGSYIPSQKYQAKGGFADTYDMIEDIGGYADIKRALGAGLKTPVPERPDPQWRPV